jgi:hypothetical protein
MFHVSGPRYDRIVSWQPDREELAWAAGFFDGEGCFSWTDKSRWGCAVIAQTNRESLGRFQEAVGGIGKIYGPYSPSRDGGWSRRPQWSFRVHRREHVQAVAAMLWFKLGPIKRAQAMKVLAKYPRVCAKGDRLVPSARGCPRCVADAWAMKRARRSGD